jgi:hypothetical protein
VSHNCWRKGTYKTETASVRATQPSQRLASVSCDCRGKPWSGPHPTITIIGQSLRDFCIAASVLWPSTCMSSPAQPSNVLCVDNPTTPRRAAQCRPIRVGTLCTQRRARKKKLRTYSSSRAQQSVSRSSRGATCSRSGLLALQSRVARRCCTPRPPSTRTEGAKTPW